MDYPLPKGATKYLTKDVGIPVNTESDTARVSGDNAAIILTSADDIGFGLVWLLDQPKWDISMVKKQLGIQFSMRPKR